MASLTLSQSGSVRLGTLWLIGVRAVDTDRHCIFSLIGKRVPVDSSLRRQTVELPDAPAYYLCGVTSPYDWSLNLHVLAFPAPGERQRIAVPGFGLELEDLRDLRIQPEWITEPERYGGDRAFLTCRNLQAAHFLRDRAGLPDRAAPRLF